MDHHRLPKRSASHGTLRGSYAYHGRPHPASPHVRLLHKPLRSVNENSALLPSPGALESMLKTTTETGDIGIFSIKPMASPRRRGTFTNIGQTQPPPRRSVDEVYGHYHRSRFPAHRDTTTEILSMYTAGSQKSLVSTLSPTSTEDLGPRSFSMTTCGSRYIPHHNSTTTLQSQASGSSLLQRPRSPFPYPTRLKRPGIRPTSPALTETGHVDYSRMVEIDRISLRTVHGAYRPIYPPGPRRPPPLGLRTDYNESIPPLHGYGQHLIRQSPRGPLSTRSQSAASVGSRNGHYRPRHDSTSTRTSSLTSIVNLYHGTPQDIRDGPGDFSAPTPAPLYYDYTEDFEPVVPGYPGTTQFPTTFPVQRMNDHRRIVPPQEPESLFVPNHSHRDSAFFDDDSQRLRGVEVADGTGTLLDEEMKAEVDTRRPDQDLHRFRSSQSSIQFSNNAVDLEHSHTARRSLRRSRGSDIDLLPSQIGRDSIDTFNPSLDIDSRNVPTYSYVHHHTSATPKTKTYSPGKMVQVQDSGTPSIRSEQGIILRDDFQEVPLYAHENKIFANIPSGSPEIPTEPESSNRRRSISAPVQDTLDKSDERRYGRRFNTRNVIRSKGQNDNFSSGKATSIPCGNGATDIRIQDEQATASLLQRDATKGGLVLPWVLIEKKEKKKKISDSSGEEQENANNTEQFRRHKRNNAALRINTKGLPRGADEGLPHITPSCSTTPIISPKPISPARQLRLKNSIPQLMKALPPLPGDPRYKAPPTPPLTSDDDFAEILSPFSFAWPFAFGQSKNSGTIKTNPDLHGDQAPSLQKNIPKLRLRMRLSETAAPIRTDNRPWTSDSNSTKKSTHLDVENARLLRGRRLPTPRKLKLRSPRTSAIDVPRSATVRRDPAARRSDIIIEIADNQETDLFHLKSSVSSALRQISRKLSHTNQVNCGKSSTARRNISGPQLEETPPQMCVSYSQHPDTNPGIDLWKPRGLRKRLSNLRSLLAHQSGFRLDSDAAPIATPEAARGKHNEGKKTNSGLSSLHQFSSSMVGCSRVLAQEPLCPRFSQRVRAKLRRWVEGAKLAVGTLAKRT